MTLPNDASSGGRRRAVPSDARRPPTGREDDARGAATGEVIAPDEDAELYRLLVGSVRDYAIFALDPGGHIISWNAGAERIKGYRPGEIIGRHFSVFYPPEDIAAGKPDRVLEIAAREGRVEDEGWRLRKDGTPFWASVVITALRDASGALVGFGKVTRDLSDRRRAEDLLRQSEERFRLLVEHVRDYAIFMLDPEGRIASWNVGAEGIKGYRAEEILGRHFSTFYMAEDVASGKPKRELEIASREGAYREEGWRVKKDGSLFWASVVITALRDPSGKLIGFAKVTRDLTERRAAQERALADARRVAEVEAASRTKSEFLTAMSHELRTPINATMGYAQLIEQGLGGPITEQQREYLARLRGSQEHLLRIVNDLLNYSRIEAGQLSLDLAPVRIEDVLDTVLPMVRPQLAVKDLALDVHPCPDGLVALVDKGRSEQIVLNLLSNAVKFTPSGGRITVSCGAAGGSAVISVKDTGPGIPSDKLEAIFEPFVQLGRSLTSRHEGTGLGLAISRDLARAMGGDVTVASVPGKGATFTFSMPRG
ncbi:MAG TPA: PAS domain-containing sensor histidine kinase [Gemmatimonadaceae bacterium]